MSLLEISLRHDQNNWRIQFMVIGCLTKNTIPYSNPIMQIIGCQNSSLCHTFLKAPLRGFRKSGPWWDNVANHRALQELSIPIGCPTDKEVGALPCLRVQKTLNIGNHQNMQKWPYPRLVLNPSTHSPPGIALWPWDEAKLSKMPPSLCVNGWGAVVFVCVFFFF